MARFRISLMRRKKRGENNLRNFLLGPLKIVADFSRVAHTLGEAFTSSRKAGLSLLLQLQEFAVLGIEFARTNIRESTNLARFCPT